MHNHILQAISDYVNDDEELHFALMLAGPWGSGKTHFVKNCLCPELEISQPSNGIKQKKAIYISLNGITNTEQIDKAIYINYLTEKDGADSKIISSGLSAFGSIVSTFKIGEKITQAVTSSAKEFVTDVTKDNKIYFIFDDLERCQLPIAESMGYVNKFVEHCDKRVIVVCNEKEIHETEQFQRIKEKLVGITIAYQHDSSNIIELMIGSVRKATTKAIAKSNQELLKRLYSNSKTRNIRLLKLAFRNLGKVVTAVNFELVPSQTQQAVIAFVFGTTFEIGTGKHSSEYLEKTLSESWFFYEAANKVAGDKKRSERDERHDYYKFFNSTYFGSIASPLHFFPTIFKSVMGAAIDKEQLKHELGLVEEDLKPQQYTSHLFNHFRDMTDSDIEQYCSKILTSAQTSALPLPTDYTSSFRALMFFREHNLFEIDISHLQKVFKEGFASALDRYDWTITFEEPYREGDPGFSEEYWKAISDYYSHTDELLAQHRKAELLQFVKASIDTDLQDLMLLLSNRHPKFKRSKIFSRDLSAVVDPKPLWDSLLKQSPKKVFLFTDVLRDWYRSAPSSQSKEATFLNDLDQLISDTLKRPEHLGKLQALAFSKLYDLITRVVNKIEEGESSKG